MASSLPTALEGFLSCDAVATDWGLTTLLCCRWLGNNILITEIFCKEGCRCTWCCCVQYCSWYPWEHWLLSMFSLSKQVEKDISRKIIMWSVCISYQVVKLLYYAVCQILIQVNCSIMPLCLIRYTFLQRNFLCKKVYLLCSMLMDSLTRQYCLFFDESSELKAWRQIWQSLWWSTQFM